MAIKFKALNYVYSKDMPYAFKALDDINLEIIEGKITAIQAVEILMGRETKNEMQI